MHTTVAIKAEGREQRISRFHDWYSLFLGNEGREPTVVTVHRVDHCFGGPEEGGWWFQTGEPIENICVFSKDQIIEELLNLHEKYESEEYAEETYDIELSTKYGSYYPVTRPHYA